MRDGSFFTNPIFVALAISIFWIVGAVALSVLIHKLSVSFVGKRLTEEQRVYIQNRLKSVPSSEDAVDDIANHCNFSTLRALFAIEHIQRRTNK